VFYPSKTDSQIDLDVLLQSFDLWIKRILKSGTGTVDITAGSPDTIVVTPGVAGMTPDAYNGKTIIVNGEEWDITDNDATTITATRTDATTIADGSYSYRVMNTAEYIGLSDGKEFTRKPEKATLTTGIPKRRIRQDLVSLDVSIKGNLQNYNKDILKTLWNLKDRSSVTRFIGRGGSNPSTSEKAEFLLQSSTVNNKATGIRIFYGEISGDGNLPLDSDKHKELPFTIDAYADPLRTVAGTTQDDDVFEFYEDL
jgi:hypothetical protein